MTRKQVRYGNGVVEPVLGIVPLEFTLQLDSSQHQHVCSMGRGQLSYWGSPFLEAQGLLVDYDGRQLLPKSS